MPLRSCAQHPPAIGDNPVPGARLVAPPDRSPELHLQQKTENPRRRLMSFGAATARRERARDNAPTELCATPAGDRRQPRTWRSPRRPTRQITRAPPSTENGESAPPVNVIRRGDRTPGASKG